MRWIASAGVLLLGLAALAGCRTPAAVAAAPASLAIVNVTVIDPETRRILPHRSVYVDGDRIVAVEAVGSRRAARATVDGSGKYLIPGLMDMHVHLFLPEPEAPTLSLLLANGVTGIREMSGDCWELAGATEGCIRDYRELQRRTRSGETPGPDLVRIASTMVMGPAQVKRDGLDPIVVPSTPDEGRRLARYLAGRGVDLIKTHDSIPTEVFYALADEARRLGVEVSGHVPFGAGVLGAAAHGYGSVEHARDFLYDCSRYGAEFRRAASDYADRKPGSAKPANPVRLRRTVEDYDPALCAAMLRRAARSGVYYTPTHVTREMEARAADPAFRRDPRRKYIPPARNKLWEADLDATAALPAGEAGLLDAFFRHGLKITGLAWRAGVPIMAGTDSSDTMIFPGFSLHDELALLARAGLPPMDVLRTATTVPAAYLRKTALYGGVSAGKEADLVLLDSDPLADVRNTRSIRAVVSNGRLYDRRALDSLLAAAEEMARQGEKN